QFARDILPYLTLVRAIQRGDVGLLEALLPTFLARFIGGGNNNSAYETLELINGDFVRQNCWLLTFTGRSESFLSFDQAQEHNIKDIKVTYKPQGPSGGWKYMQVLHPAIPTIRRTTDFIDQAFNTLTRSKRHTAPKKEQDIQKLLERLRGVHSNRRGRQLDKEGRSEDYIANGVQSMVSGSILETWKKNCTYERNTEERYTTPGEQSDESVCSDTDSNNDTEL
ncbi:hypothetical protein R3P38DRAFT_2584178, partial [Favolaschia claudopus]